MYSYVPSKIIFSIGPIHIYWYGFFIVLGILFGLMIALFLAKRAHIKQETVLDLAIALIITGILGARVYDNLLNFSYYLNHPAKIFAVWEGGLAVHGAIITGVITLLVFAHLKKINFWLLASITSVALAFGQAIGRFGNYFNQELFGRPTNLPWGIPIDLAHRPFEYMKATHFHPTFLYASFGNLLIGIIIFWLCFKIIKAQNKKYFAIPALAYLALYSILRFGLEFIRIDPAPIFLGLRWPQIISAIILLASLFLLIALNRNNEKKS